MKQVAIVAMLIFAAATVATLLIQSSRERAARFEQARSQHEELTRRLARLEQMLAAMRADRRDATHTTVSEGLPSGSASTRERSTQDATAAAGADARKIAEHSERIQAGNAAVDHAIQAGRWGPAEIAAFGSATSGLSGEERADIMVRLSAAINADQVQLDMRPRPQ
jgi:outer membrane murein-binding lipoprotein Lpp